MKRNLIIITLALLTVIAVLTACAATAKKEASVTKANPLLGTWQLALYKYGSTSSAFIVASPVSSRIKMITDTHFLWVHFDRTTKTISGSAGGTYTLTGDKYTESIDFGLGMNSYVGTKPAYTVKVEGDKLFLSGDLSEGYQIEEVWERVK